MYFFALIPKSVIANSKDKIIIIVYKFLQQQGGPMMPQQQGPMMTQTQMQTGANMMSQQHGPIVSHSQQQGPITSQAQQQQGPITSQFQQGQPQQAQAMMTSQAHPMVSQVRTQYSKIRRKCKKVVKSRFTKNCKNGSTHCLPQGLKSTFFFIFFEMS